MSKSYLVDPQIDVQVLEFRSQWVYVGGEVMKPGRIPLRGGTRLKEILGEHPMFGVGILLIAGYVLGKVASMARLPEITGYMAWDMEAWAMDTERFETLLARLQPMKKVVILSGDVHYTFSAEMDYWKKGVSTPTRIVQLTSSAIKNEWPKVLKRVLSTGTGQKILHNAFYPCEPSFTYPRGHFTRGFPHRRTSRNVPYLQG